MKIIIFPNLNKKNALKCTLEACDVLNGLGAELYLSEEYVSDFSGKTYINFGNFNELIKTCDAIIAIGGDGTILKCSKLIANYHKPILGINSGRLGFMANLEANEIDQLKKLTDGNYTIVNRMMLKSKLVRKNGEIVENSALNDIVVSKSQTCKISDFEVSLDGQVVSSLRADGLIFSTPTGSTAYSLSAGGPIIEPDMECIEFTQICPFSLFARTMIFSPDKTLKVTFKSTKRSSIMISIDGNDEINFETEDTLYISKSDNYIKFIDINDASFYNSINTKLMQPLKGTIEELE